MKASDIMTSPVLTVGPETQIKEIAALLFERRISAVPVVDGGALVGIVSEADLLHRQEIGTECLGR
ncbi:MAG: CBS domain-containing protein, partial [Burkholderiales bacterium]